MKNITIDWRDPRAPPDWQALDRQYYVIQFTTKMM